MAADLPKGFQCSCCGEWHDELLLDVGYREPLCVDERTPEQRDRDVKRLGDFRELTDEDGTHYFVRGVIELPIIGSDEQFCYGVWVSLSAVSYEKARAAYRDNSSGGPFFGWLANRIGGYPDTLSLKTEALCRPRLRPSITLEPTDHPLAVEQRAGITLDRVREIGERALHGEPTA